MIRQVIMSDDDDDESEDVVVNVNSPIPHQKISRKRKLNGPPIQGNDNDHDLDSIVMPPPPPPRQSTMTTRSMSRSPSVQSDDVDRCQHTLRDVNRICRPQTTINCIPYIRAMKGVYVYQNSLDSNTTPTRYIIDRIVSVGVVLELNAVVGGMSKQQHVRDFILPIVLHTGAAYKSTRTLFTSLNNFEFAVVLGGVRASACLEHPTKCYYESKVYKFSSNLNCKSFDAFASEVKSLRTDHITYVYIKPLPVIDESALGRYIQLRNALPDINKNLESLVESINTHGPYSHVLESK